MEMVRSNYRVPKDVDEWLKQSAAHQSRSKNGQLIEYLKQKMREEKNGQA